MSVKPLRTISRIPSKAIPKSGTCLAERHTTGPLMIPSEPGVPAGPGYRAATGRRANSVSMRRWHQNTAQCREHDLRNRRLANPWVVNNAAPTAHRMRVLTATAARQVII